MWGGMVTDSYGNGLKGVLVTMDGTSSLRTATTDSSGAFIFKDVGASDCTFTPTKSGYVFSPEQIVLTIDSSTPANIEFTGYPSGFVPYGSLSDHNGSNELITEEKHL